MELDHLRTSCAVYLHIRSEKVETEKDEMDESEASVPTKLAIGVEGGFDGGDDDGDDVEVVTTYSLVVYPDIATRIPYAHPNGTP